MEDGKPAPSPETSAAQAQSLGYQKIVAILGGLVAVIGALTGLFAALPPFAKTTVETYDYFRKGFPGQESSTNPGVPAPSALIANKDNASPLPSRVENIVPAPGPGCTEIISSDARTFPPKVTHSWDCPKDHDK